jgi:hypothetical protein
MRRLDLVIRKQQVLGSNPSVGSSDLTSEAGREAGFLAFRDMVDGCADSHGVQIAV